MFAANTFCSWELRNKMHSRLYSQHVQSMLRSHPRSHDVCITRRSQRVNIFTPGDYGCSDHDRIILLTPSNMKFNSLSFGKNIFSESPKSMRRLFCDSILKNLPIALWRQAIKKFTVNSCCPTLN